jgi:hypothetical protein|tara:strand:- start:1257 stop:1541 length:285 start_codon:yes stop_codon:yes gene_type:complete
LLAVLVIYVAMMEPIRVGFTLETDRTSDVFGGLYWFELVVDLLFIADLFVCTYWPFPNPDTLFGPITMTVYSYAWPERLTLSLMYRKVFARVSS